MPFMLQHVQITRARLAACEVGIFSREISQLSKICPPPSFRSHLSSSPMGVFSRDYSIYIVAMVMSILHEMHLLNFILHSPFPRQYTFPRLSSMSPNSKCCSVLGMKLILSHATLSNPLPHPLPPLPLVPLPLSPLPIPLYVIPVKKNLVAKQHSTNNINVA